MAILICSTVAALALSIAACAPIVWDKPGATQAEFNADNYDCKAQARTLSPGGGYAQGSVGFVVAATLISAVATAADRSGIYNDCMKAHGYMARQAEPPASPIQVATSPPQKAEAEPPASPIRVATSPPQEAEAPVARAGVAAPASTSAGGPQPGASQPRAAVPSPQGPGRVMLFPVTVYNPYYPSSVFVDVQ